MKLSVMSNRQPTDASPVKLPSVSYQWDKRSGIVELMKVAQPVIATFICRISQFCSDLKKTDYGPASCTYSA